MIYQNPHSSEPTHHRHRLRHHNQMHAIKCISMQAPPIYWVCCGLCQQISNARMNKNPYARKVDGWSFKFNRRKMQINVQRVASKLSTCMENCHQLIQAICLHGLTAYVKVNLIQLQVFDVFGRGNAYRWLGGWLVWCLVSTAYHNLTKTNRNYEFHFWEQFIFLPFAFIHFIIFVRC